MTVRQALVILMLLAWHESGQAQPASRYPLDRTVGAVEVGLNVLRDETALAGAGPGIRTRTTAVEAALYEAVRSRVVLGLIGGAAVVTQPGQALTAGMRLTGHYLALELRAAIPGGSAWRLGVNGRVTYQSVSDEAGGTRVDLDWIDTGAELAAEVNLGQDLALHGGVLYRRLDADQRARGGSDATLSLHADESTGLLLGLSWQVDPGGYVDLEARNGAHEGFMLSFRRAY